MENQGAAAAPATEPTPEPSTSSGISGGTTGKVFMSSKKKHEEKIRKKDPKSWENASKTWASLPEENKMAQIEKKYQELYNEFRKIINSNQQLQKQNTTLQKERDYNQSELTKSIVARARLEDLCRELQKQNKQIKEENLAKIKEEEERRKEVSLKFADKLSDINNMMDENKEKSDKLREENLKMTTKLAELYEQFQKREEDIAKMSHQLELERQYSQATLTKMDLELKAEREIHAKELAILQGNLTKSEANCNVLLETVKGLQEHIDVYKTQYEGFETTMSKSAKVFDSFKAEIANMTKQVATLERESQSWKSKFHDSMRAIVEMSEIKKNQDMYQQSLEKKNDQLQKLCRQLQTDRTNFLKLLKSHGIEPVSQCASEETQQMTKKEKELELLKENLRAVQDELSKLSTDEPEEIDLKQDELNSLSPGITENDFKKTDDNQTSQIKREPESAKDVPSTISDVPSTQGSLGNEENQEMLLAPQQILNKPNTESTD